MEQQLRLGRFNTKRCGLCMAVVCVTMSIWSRQGAQFVEVWVEGFAFSDLNTRQEELTAQREELEKLKKQSNKKKASAITLREQFEKEEILKMRAAVLKKVNCC